MKYKAVLFDYDGTIVDSNQVIVESWNYMTKKFVGEVLPTDMLIKTFGLPLIDAFKHVAKDYGLEVTEELLHEMDKAYSGYQYEHTLDGYPTFPGMIELIKKLVNKECLEAKYKDHGLIGDYKDCRECHITPDWLLIYQIDGNELILYLTRTGTHSDLF